MQLFILYILYIYKSKNYEDNMGIQVAKTESGWTITKDGSTFSVTDKNKNGQWVDQKTNRFINVQGMDTGKTASTANTLSRVGRVAGGAVGVTLGTAGVIDSVSGQEEHSWGDVLEGTISGGIAAATGASALNAFVGVGNLAYAITVASGALVGGLVAGSQLFSETDCLYDPVTTKYTCCHTQFNKGKRYADIGEYMFCSKAQQDGTEVIFKPAVRRCVQGNMNNKDSWSGEKASWFAGLWKDDFWTPECEVRICDNVLPQSGIDEYIDYTPDTEHFCWNWDCINGYTRSGNTCIKVSLYFPTALPGSGSGSGHRPAGK